MYLPKIAHPRKTTHKRFLKVQVWERFNLGTSKKFKKTVVGNNVVIGSNSTILPVKIADNIVIGAGSVVTKDLKTKGIYAGNPAKLIRRL